MLGGTQIFFLDSHENCLGEIRPSGIFTTSADTKYIMFSTRGIYGSTYNNDICINISHSAVANGTYHPYVEFEHEVPVNKYFPDGMRSAMYAYDEINEKEAIQRICSFKVSDCFDNMVFVSSENMAHFTTPYALALPSASNIFPNVICNKLITSYQETLMSLGSAITLNANTGEINIRDTSVTRLEHFKQKYGDVTIYAELAEPIVTPLKTRAVNFNYPVWDWGTERAVSAEPDAIANVPFRADIIYGFNAVDTIRNNKILLNKLDEEAITPAIRKLNVIDSIICTETDIASQYLICASLPVNQCIYMNFNGQGFRKWRKVATTSDNMVVMECEHKYDDTQFLYRLQLLPGSYQLYSFNMPSNTVRYYPLTLTSGMNLQVYSGVSYLNCKGSGPLTIRLDTHPEPMINENTNYEVHILNLTGGELVINVVFHSNAFGTFTLCTDVTIPSNREAIARLNIPFYNRTKFVSKTNDFLKPTDEDFYIHFTIEGWDENNRYTQLW